MGFGQPKIWLPELATASLLTSSSGSSKANSTMKLDYSSTSTIRNLSLSNIIVDKESTFRPVEESLSGILSKYENSYITVGVGGHKADNNCSLSNYEEDSVIVEYDDDGNRSGTRYNGCFNPCRDASFLESKPLSEKASCF